MHAVGQLHDPQGSKRKADTAASESEGAKYDEPDTETEDEADKHRSGGLWLLGDGGWLVGFHPRPRWLMNSLLLILPNVLGIEDLHVGAVG